MKDSLIILATCAPCPNEVLLWDAFIAENKDKFNILFFTPFEYKLDISTVIKIENLFFHMEKDEIEEGLSSILSEIAECDKIWENYDRVESVKRAYSWFHYCKFILKLFMPAAVYVWNGYHLEARAMTKAAEELGIERYVMERGPFANTFVCDESGINYASSFITAYNNIGESTDEKAIREFIHLYFKSGISNWEQPDASAGKEEFYNKYNIPKDKILIFFPLQMDNDTNAKVFSPHYISVFEAYSDIVAAIGDFQDKVFLLVKKHPKQKDINLFVNTPISSGLLVEDAHIFDCIKYSNAIISINSSSAIEAALLGKPVLLLGNSILSANEKVLSIKKPGDLRRKLDELIDMADSRDDFVDFAYFSKLLFHYLYTTMTAYQDIGIAPVKNIQTPEPRSLNDRTFFTSQETILLIKALSSLQHGVKHDMNPNITQQRLAEKDRQLAEKDSQLAEKDSQLAEKDRWLVQSDNQLTARRRELEKIDSQLTVKIRDIEEREQQIGILLNTYSWKITAPLRWAHDLLFKGNTK